MNRNEYREENDKAQARTTIETFLAAIIMFGLPIFLGYNFGIGIFYGLGIALVATGAMVWFIERAI